MAKLQKYIKKQIGDETHTFVVEGNDLHEVVMASQNLSFYDVKCCGACGSKKLKLSAHVTEADKHEYVTIRCTSCGSQVNFGQQKKMKDIFYLKTRDEIDERGVATGEKVLDWRNKDNQPVVVKYK
jgi:RNase P subunit RPR2